MIQLTPRQTDLLGRIIAAGEAGYCFMANQVEITADLLALALPGFIRVPRGSLRAHATAAGQAFATRSAT